MAEEAWERAVRIAREDRPRLARLVRSGRVHRDRNARQSVPLPPPPRNPTIRPNKKKRGKR